MKVKVAKKITPSDLKKMGVNNKLQLKSIKC